MTSLATATSNARLAPGFALCVAILVVLTLVRLAGLGVSVVDLYMDEAQYWAWSRELAFGYYSKPPLLAWVIAAAESVCGTGEACVRAPAPIFYLATSLVVYAIARALYDGRTAFWAALTVALAPGVVFSSRIISTDVPLLFFWALALLSYVKLLQGRDLRWALLLGIALGLGTLAKYAMVYFLLGIALAALLDRDARKLLRPPAVLLALAAAAVLIAPNILWNIEHGFATFAHTGENIRGSGLQFNLLTGLEFLAAQFAVFGPIAFAVLLFAIAAFRSERTTPTDRLLLAFALPVLALIAVSAFASRANPNWAATAYVSGAIVVAAVLVRHQAWRLLSISVAIGVFVQVALIAGDVTAHRLTIPGLAQPDVYERTMGWRALGTETGRLAAQAETRTVVAERRDDVAALLYYHPDGIRHVRAWPNPGIPGNHFEMTRPLAAGAPEPILLISRHADVGRIAEHFADVQALGRVEVPTGPTSTRSYHAFRLSGARDTLGAPVPGQ